MGEHKRYPLSMGMNNTNNRQPQFDVNEAIQKKCERCGNGYFNLKYTLGFVPKIASKNETNMDILIKSETFFCTKCNHEYGKPIPPNFWSRLIKTKG